MSEILHLTVYKDENIELFLERHPHYGLIIHCYVYKWGKKQAKDFYTLWVVVLAEFGIFGFEKVYAAIRPDDEKLIKFASMYGFTYTGEYVTDSKGDQRVMYQCLI